MPNIELPKTVKEIIKMLNSAGYEAYAVGGCVRDILMGKAPDDYDITTNALPKEIKSVFGAYKTIDTGIKHGTVTVVMNSFHTEITTYRTDGIYSDGRHPDRVSFSKKLCDDLSRRDFTVNAIAYDGARIIDEFGGTDDIKKGVIRCVGNPRRRFSEDGLRILRALRFGSVLNFEIEPDTKDAVFECLPLLDNISRERILEETKKLVCGVNAYNVLMKYEKVTEKIFGSIASYTFDQYAITVRMSQKAENDFHMRFAALLYFLPVDDARCALRSLKMSNKDTANTLSYLKKPDVHLLKSVEQVCRYMYFEGEATMQNSLKMYQIYCRCVNDKDNEQKAAKVLRTVNRVLKSEMCFKLSQLAVNGRDILNAGLAVGKEVGRLLESLLFAVIEGKTVNEKKALLSCAEKILNSREGNVW